jgi:hypothetical protein
MTYEIGSQIRKASKNSSREEKSLPQVPLSNLELTEGNQFFVKKSMIF